MALACGNTSPVSPPPTPTPSSHASKPRTVDAALYRADLHRPAAYLGECWAIPPSFQTRIPVGTGPMKLKSFSAQLISYVKNPTYWQADKVKVDELNYPAVASNDTALLKMASDQADWTAIFDPAVKTAFVDKDPAHNFSYPVPVVPVQIVPNLKIRCSASSSCARPSARRSTATQMSISGEAGLEQPASPTGLIPGQEQYLDPKYNGHVADLRRGEPSQGGSNCCKGLASRRARTASMPTPRATSSTSP